MAFELYVPKRRVVVDPGGGWVNRGGHVFLSPADLSKVGIVDKAVILFDQPARRLALRPPMSRADMTVEPFACVHRNKRGTSAWIAIRGALHAIGVTAQQAMEDMVIVVKDDPKIIVLHFVTRRKGMEAGHE